MQCPLSSYCCLFPKFVFLAASCFGLALGLLSVIRPKQSIGFYQRTMERFNWKVVPINESREVRNTRILGVALAALSLAIFFIVAIRF